MRNAFSKQIFKSLYATEISSKNQSSYYYTKEGFVVLNYLKKTIISKVTLVLFTHVFLRDHYVLKICGRYLDSIISGSSDLHQSNGYVSSGLFEIVAQTNYIPF